MSTKKKAVNPAKAKAKTVSTIKEKVVNSLKQIFKGALEGAKDIVIDDAYLHIKANPSEIISNAQIVQHVVKVANVLGMDVELEILGVTIRIKDEWTKEQVIEKLAVQGLSF